MDMKLPITLWIACGAIIIVLLLRHDWFWAAIDAVIVIGTAIWMRKRSREGQPV